MRVVDPTELLRAAADALEQVMDDVVVIGAAAVQVMLQGSESVVAPTRDVDTGVGDVASGERVIGHLEGRLGMKRSVVPHESAFTWVKGELKLQVVRPIRPLVAPPVAGLPTNQMIGEAIEFRVPVAFVGEPSRQRMWMAGPAALVGLKEIAFGRTRPDGALVERDYSDVVLLLDHCLPEIVNTCRVPSVMARRVVRAATRIQNEPQAREGAIRQLVATGNHPTELDAEKALARITQRTVRLLTPG